MRQLWIRAQNRGLVLLVVTVMVSVGMALLVAPVQWWRSTEEDVLKLKEGVKANADSQADMWREFVERRADVDLAIKELRKELEAYVSRRDIATLADLERMKLQHQIDGHKSTK